MMGRRWSVAVGLLTVMAAVAIGLRASGAGNDRRGFSVSSARHIVIG
jgi:hypothetical protein